MKTRAQELEQISERAVSVLLESGAAPLIHVEPAAGGAWCVVVVTKKGSFVVGSQRRHVRTWASLDRLVRHWRVLGATSIQLSTPSVQGDLF